MIAGGFGAGKTTLVGAVSEIAPLRTEETITVASTGTDSLTGIEEKTTTTVAMDFGRITFTDPLPVVLYLFGTPGQDRFHHLWEHLFDGAVGAVVLADTRRLETCFAALTRAEAAGIPVLVAVNTFDDTRPYTHTQIRTALDLPAHTPLLTCDARDPRSAAGVLVRLVQHARTLTTTQGSPR
ncbi:GTP-binding protein [Streptomyces uncialis]|uniref:GTP-binding protein n=1 Tax=Streptomyces uncialis TaxID=1048205 RepID=UPI00380FFD73